MPARKSSASSSGATRPPPKKAPAQSTTIIASGPSSSKLADAPSTDAHMGLVVEFLTFNPRAFIDALVYVANEALYQLGEQFEPKVYGMLKDAGSASEEEAQKEAERGTHSIVTLLENALDHVFDTLELYSLQNVFGLTSRQAHNFVLPHHRGLDLRASQNAQDGKDAADEESTQLSARQRELNRRISAAKSTSHALSLGVAASERRLARVRAVYNLTLTMLGRDAATAQTEEDVIADAADRLSHAVEVIKAQRDPMLDGIKRLKEVDPLGEALIHSTSKLETGGADDANAEDVKPQAGREPWSSGREGYLRWQTERMLSSDRRTGAGGDDGDVTVGDTSTIGKGPGGRKRKSNARDGDAARRTGGRPSLHSTEGGMEGEEVGKTGEMEQLAQLLQHRPASTSNAATAVGEESTAADTTSRPRTTKASTSRKSRS